MSVITISIYNSKLASNFPSWRLLKRVFSKLVCIFLTILFCVCLVRQLNKNWNFLNHWVFGHELTLQASVLVWSIQHCSEPESFTNFIFSKYFFVEWIYLLWVMQHFHEISLLHNFSWGSIAGPAPESLPGLKMSEDNGGQVWLILFYTHRLCCCSSNSLFLLL